MIFVSNDIDDISNNSMFILNGDVAQMVERSLCMREVQGSIPCISNMF